MLVSRLRVVARLEILCGFQPLLVGAQGAQCTSVPQGVDVWLPGVVSTLGQQMQQENCMFVGLDVASYDQ